MEPRFWDAVNDGNVEEVREILENHPNVDVNWKNEDWIGHLAAMHRACRYGHDSIVAILLAHPGIKVNVKDSYGHTPFMIACLNDHTSCARLMLEDQRAAINEPSNNGYTPLRDAAHAGNLEIIKWWVASGREMDLGEPGDSKTDAIGEARKNLPWRSGMEKDRKTAVVTLLERFKENPEETRPSVRVELGYQDEMAAAVFAIVVFVSDGLLRVTQGDESTTPAARFFSIASQLPMELQMVLCYRVVDSGKENISAFDSEAAFRDLSRVV